jgi:hypothetical protein
VSKQNRFLSSIGGREAQYDKLSVDANLILSQEMEKEKKIG